MLLVPPDPRFALAVAFVLAAGLVLGHLASLLSEAIFLARMAELPGRSAAIPFERALPRPLVTRLSSRLRPWLAHNANESEPPPPPWDTHFDLPRFDGTIDRVPVVTLP